MFLSCTYDFIYRVCTKGSSYCFVLLLSVCILVCGELAGPCLPNGWFPAELVGELRGLSFCACVYPPAKSCSGTHNGPALAGRLTAAAVNYRPASRCSLVELHCFVSGSASATHTKNSIKGFSPSRRQAFLQFITSLGALQLKLLHRYHPRALSEFANDCILLFFNTRLRSSIFCDLFRGG